MTATVSITNKKEFVRWFLEHYQLKRRESIWILNYLLGQDELLDNIHFTDEVEYCPRAIVMSTVEMESVPFQFYKGNVMTIDAEKSFHDLRLQKNEKMYVQLEFPNSNTCPLYASVREENPYVPQELRVSATDKKIAEQLIEKSVTKINRAMLQQAIDRSLDQQDEKSFIYYTTLLQELDNNSRNRSFK